MCSPKDIILGQTLIDISDILHDYDGNRTPEGLMGLIDEVRAIAKKAIYETKSKDVTPEVMDWARGELI